MTKDEMIRLYANDNYDIIQNHIKDAMQSNEHYIYVGQEYCSSDFKRDWVCLDSTVEKLRDDGFEVESCSYDQWKISW